MRANCILIQPKSRNASIANIDGCAGCMAVEGRRSCRVLPPSAFLEASPCRACASRPLPEGEGKRNSNPAMITILFTLSFPLPALPGAGPSIPAAAWPLLAGTRLLGLHGQRREEEAERRPGRVHPEVSFLQPRPKRSNRPYSGHRAWRRTAPGAGSSRDYRLGPPDARVLNRRRTSHSGPLPLGSRVSGRRSGSDWKLHGMAADLRG